MEAPKVRRYDGYENGPGSVAKMICDEPATGGHGTGLIYEMGCHRAIPDERASERSTFHPASNTAPEQEGAAGISLRNLNAT
jgi:hypothetical protein